MFSTGHKRLWTFASPPRNTEEKRKEQKKREVNVKLFTTRNHKKEASSTKKYER